MQLNISAHSARDGMEHGAICAALTALNSITITELARAATEGKTTDLDRYYTFTPTRILAIDHVTVGCRRDEIQRARATALLGTH